MKPTLTTSRLTLIPFEKEDLAVLHLTFTNPFGRKFLWDDEIIPLETTKDILTKSETYFQQHHWGLWKILLTAQQRYAGFAGLWYFFDESQPQLLYGVLPDQTNQGLATEASEAVIQYAFEQLGFSYLTASCDTPHTDSKKVCERLGMKLVEEKNINGKSTTFYRIDRP